MTCNSRSSLNWHLGQQGTFCHQFAHHIQARQLTCKKEETTDSMNTYHANNAIRESQSLVHCQPSKKQLNRARRGRLTAVQIKQCSLIFARSALLREQYDRQGISYPDIPMSAIFSVLQDLKLPFGLLFRSLAICDGKIAGLPIKAHSEKFVLSSCGLEVGSCKFLNLPLNGVDRCSSKYGDGDDDDDDDDVCGRTYINTELGGGPFKYSESGGKTGSGAYWKTMSRCGDDLSFTLDFAREMIEPSKSQKVKVASAERTEGKKGRTHLLASRIDFSDIVRRIIELEDGDLSPWGPNGNHSRQLWSMVSQHRSEQPKSHVNMKKAFPYHWPTESPTTLIIPFDPPTTSPRRRHLYREFDFLCFIRLITEIQKYFLIVKPISQCSSASASASSSSSSSPSPGPSSPEAASTSHRALLSSRYQLAWTSPALASGYISVNKTKTKTNENERIKQNNPNREANILSLLDHHTPFTELNDLLSHMAKHKSFMTKARWGPDAQRIWVCGVPVSDGSSAGGGSATNANVNGNGNGNDNVNGTDAEKSKTAAADGRRAGLERPGQQQQQQQTSQRRNKWWVLFLLKRRLTRYIQC